MSERCQLTWHLRLHQISQGFFFRTRGSRLHRQPVVDEHPCFRNGTVQVFQRTDARSQDSIDALTQLTTLLQSVPC